MTKPTVYAIMNSRTLLKTNSIGKKRVIPIVVRRNVP